MFKHTIPKAPRKILLLNINFRLSTFSFGISTFLISLLVILPTMLDKRTEIVIVNTRSFVAK